MRDIIIREFNDKFLKEINSLYVVNKFGGELIEKDLNKMHRIIGDGILKALYDEYPTMIHFYPYFSIFSSNKSIFNRKMFKSSEESSFKKFIRMFPEKATEMLKRGEKKKALREALFRRF